MAHLSHLQGHKVLLDALRQGGISWIPMSSLDMMSTEMWQMKSESDRKFTQVLVLSCVSSLITGCLIFYFQYGRSIENVKKAIITWVVVAPIACAMCIGIRALVRHYRTRREQ